MTWERFRLGVSFVSFLRNCGKLAARCSALRYVTRLEKRGEKRIVCRRWIENGGTEAHINDKRVHESLANVLISGERKGAGESVFFLMEGHEDGG